MMAKLQSPLFAAIAGIMISVSLGMFMGAKAFGPLLAQAAAVVERKVPEELAVRGWDFWTIEIDNLSNELKEERARLRKQAEVLNQRASRAAVEERELAKLRADIERLRKEIADRVVEISADEAKNIRTLAQTYAVLTPRAAMAIFKELDDVTAVKILSMMKAETVGPIFEEMAKTSGPDGAMARRAALLSEKLRMMKTGKTSSGPT